MSLPDCPYRGPLVDRGCTCLASPDPRLAGVIAWCEPVLKAEHCPEGWR